MAMSGHDEQIIADLERQFATGDPTRRYRRRFVRWLLVDLMMTMSGLMGCLVGLVVWWPGAAIAGGVAAIGIGGAAHVVSVNRTWLTVETQCILQRAWLRFRVWGRGLRRMLDV
jgi:hypothetical protein